MIFEGVMGAAKTSDPAVYTIHHTSSRKKLQAAKSKINLHQPFIATTGTSPTVLHARHVHVATENRKALIQPWRWHSHGPRALAATMYVGWKRRQGPTCSVIFWGLSIEHVRQAPRASSWGSSEKKKQPSFLWRAPPFATRGRRITRWAPFQL